MTKAEKEAREATSVNERRTYAYMCTRACTCAHTHAHPHTFFPLGKIELSRSLGETERRGGRQLMASTTASLTAANPLGLFVKEFFKSGQSWKTSPQS